MKSIAQIILSQRNYFNSNSTKSIDYRKEKLRKLKSILQENETAIYKAIYSDFKKSEFDTYASELALVYHEIDTALKKVSKWSRKKRVNTNIVNIPGRSYIHPEPLGVCLVIGAWNYPIQLTLAPVIGALAAGNTAILKPSELTPHTSKLLCEILNTNFDNSYLYVYEGGITETTALLEQKVDHIFFTGSTFVGKIVYQAAAKNLTPVSLELGGKSPAIISESANLKIIELCKQEIKKADYKFENHNFSQIITNKHFNRLSEYLNEGTIETGGTTNPKERFIAPTLITDINFDSLCMQDEIFGPILPIIEYTNFDQIISTIKQQEKPLSLYLFTEKNNEKNKVINQLSFGGGCINDAVMHITNSKLPFGGVGSSGIGNYHGKYSFDTFSHHKSIISKPTWFELPLKFSPLTSSKLKWIKLLMRF